MACSFFYVLCFVFSLFLVSWFQSEAQKQLEEIRSLREKMKEVADEARGKEELHKQLVIRLSGFSSAFDNVSSIPVNSFLRYTSDRNVNNSEAIQKHFFQCRYFKYTSQRGTQSQTKIRNRPPSTKGRVFPCIWKHFLFLLKIAEYETMRKDVNRSAYTRRILEIVGNIKKQKEEINKVKQFSTCWMYSRFALVLVYQAKSLVTKPRSSYSTNQIQNVIKRDLVRRVFPRFSRAFGWFHPEFLLAQCEIESFCDWPKNHVQIVWPIRWSTKANRE